MNENSNCDSISQRRHFPCVGLSQNDKLTPPWNFGQTPCVGLSISDILGWNPLHFPETTFPVYGFVAKRQIHPPPWNFGQTPCVGLSILDNSGENYSILLCMSEFGSTYSELLQTSNTHSFPFLRYLMYSTESMSGLSQPAYWHFSLSLRFQLNQLGGLMCKYPIIITSGTINSSFTFLANRSKSPWKSFGLVNKKRERVCVINCSLFNLDITGKIFFFIILLYYFNYFLLLFEIQYPLKIVSNTTFILS